MKMALSVALVLVLSGTALAEYGEYRRPARTTYIVRPYYGAAASFGVVDGSSIPAFTTAGFASFGSFGLPAPGVVGGNDAARRELANQARARALRLRPIRNAKYARIRAEIVADREAKKQARLAARWATEVGAREWTDSKGRTLIAKFVERSGESVRLRKADSTILTAPFALFSDADQRFIREQQGEQTASLDVAQSTEN